MTPEILYVMEQRKSFKNKDQTKCNEIHKIIRKKKREAKGKFYVDKYKEIDTDRAERVERWHEYIDGLFDYFWEHPEGFHVEDNNISPDITKDDNNMSNGKAPGLDEIPIDVVKIL